MFNELDEHGKKLIQKLLFSNERCFTKEDVLSFTYEPETYISQIKSYFELANIEFIEIKNHFTIRLQNTSFLSSTDFSNLEKILITHIVINKFDLEKEITVDKLIEKLNRKKIEKKIETFKKSVKKSLDSLVNKHLLIKQGDSYSIDWAFDAFVNKEEILFKYHDLLKEKKINQLNLKSFQQEM